MAGSVYQIAVRECGQLQILAFLTQYALFFLRMRRRNVHHCIKEEELESLLQPALRNKVRKFVTTLERVHTTTPRPK